MPTDWPGMLGEPMDRATWLAYLRELSDSDLDELCNTTFVRERDDAQAERERRIDDGEWMSDR